METITLDLARKFVLFAQGLLHSSTQSAKSTMVKETISRLGVLQIDTINIVARSPYFSVWSRVGDFEPAWINQYLEERQIFEYWAHMASFLPIGDYPLHRRLMLERVRLPGFENWYAEHKSISDAVLDRIRDNGPTRSSDFERQDGQRGTWWNWKVEKQALEYWFVTGELMISKRMNFQRVYDLRERVMPNWKDADAPDLGTVYRTLVVKSIAAMGFVLSGWVTDYFRLPKKIVQPIIQKLIDEKRLIELKVQDWEEPGWALPDIWEAYQTEMAHHPDPQNTTILTPFDSLIWDRARTRRLFNFDYSIECYTPAAKRKFGYFLLPILHNGQLIGRLDAKAHRGEGRFEVKSLYLEPGVTPDQQLVEGLASTLVNCAAWHKTPEVQVMRCDPAGFFDVIQSRIKRSTR